MNTKFNLSSPLVKNKYSEWSPVEPDPIRTFKDLLPMLLPGSFVQLRLTNGHELVMSSDLVTYYYGEMEQPLFPALPITHFRYVDLNVYISGRYAGAIGLMNARLKYERKSYANRVIEHHFGIW